MIQLTEIKMMILHGYDAYKFYIFKNSGRLLGSFWTSLLLLALDVGVYVLSLFECFESLLKLIQLENINDIFYFLGNS